MRRKVAVRRCAADDAARGGWWGCSGARWGSCGPVRRRCGGDVAVVLSMLSLRPCGPHVCVGMPKRSCAASARTPTSTTRQSSSTNSSMAWPTQRCRSGVRLLAGRLRRCHDQVVAWYTARVNNGPMEALSNMIKRKTSRIRNAPIPSLPDLCPARRPTTQLGAT